MLLTARNLHKSYHKYKEEVPVLTGVDLDVTEGEFLAIVGQSGSGKSTLMHLLGTLDRPDKGEIRLSGQRIDNRSAAERDKLRNRVFGFVFQFYHLLPELSALENVLMPQMIRQSVWSWFGSARALRERAKSLLERVGLGARMHHKPRELSGGEMQRTAIARALMGEPRVLLADEPTGNLDAEKGGQILQLLRDLNTQERLTIIMVTHNTEILSATDRVVKLARGRVEQVAVEKPVVPLSVA
jgi:lipoprotein-releasing system ATP-binding protein